jgi:hypothetical protein
MVLTKEQLKKRREMALQMERDKRFRERRAKDGLIQVRYWIPAEERPYIDQYIERKRRKYLESKA